MVLTEKFLHFVNLKITLFRPPIIDPPIIFFRVHLELKSNNCALSLIIFQSSVENQEEQKNRSNSLFFTIIQKYFVRHFLKGTLTDI